LRNLRLALSCGSRLRNLRLRAALLLAAFTIVAALIGHRFWDITDAAQRGNQLNHFWKNIAMIGGFLALYVAGAGALSIDARRGRENARRQ
jgi:uncharacterized membrane protein YphA (DoxX/SURF4 family)